MRRVLFDEDDDRLLRFTTPTSRVGKIADPYEQDILRAMEGDRARIVIPREYDIPTKPFKIYCAHGVEKRNQLKLVDYNRDGGFAIALQCSVWSLASGKATKLVSCDARVTAVAWCPKHPSWLGFGTKKGFVGVIDTATSTMICKFQYQPEIIVPQLCWFEERLALAIGDELYVLKTGTKSKFYRFRGLKLSNTIITSMCWTRDGSGLSIASADKQLLFLDRSGYRVRARLATSSVIKAMAWCPWHSNMLVTGDDDGLLRIYKYDNLALEIETGEPVSELVFNPNARQLCTAHYSLEGTPLRVWQFCEGSFKIITTLHSMTEGTALYMTLAPDGNTVAVVSCSENLSLWQVFEKTQIDQKIIATPTPTFGLKSVR